MRNRIPNETTTSDSSSSVQTKSNDIMPSIRMISSLSSGIVFGYLMNKANICLSPIIRDQMLFKRFTMIKMFLAAVGTSMLSVVIICHANQALYDKVLRGFIQRNNRINAFQLILGGSLIGVGMVLAGSCPGTVFVQIGSGLPNSLLTGLGACAGVLFYYSVLHDRLTNVELSKSSLVLRQLTDFINVKRTYINALFGSVLLSIAFLLEHKIPYKMDTIGLNRSAFVDIWSPVWCGIGIGALQLPFTFLFEKSLGISTGFSVVVAQLCRVDALKNRLRSLEPFKSGLQNNITLLFSTGAILGSGICSLLMKDFPLSAKLGANGLNSFLGGFLLLVGARCAGGCTSGQGISGVSHLLIGSLIATASMFAGGMIFAAGYGFITNDWKFSSL